jgi:hypothetical protein
MEHDLTAQEVAERVVEEQPQQTQPQTQQAQTSTPSIDPLVQAAMRELRERNLELEKELATRQAQPTEKATFDTFMADPETLIARAVEKQIAPLKQYVAQFQKESAYETIKRQFASHPQYASAIAQYGPQIDELMRNADPTAQNLHLAVVAAVGQAALNGVTPNMNAPTNTPQPYVPNTMASQPAAPLPPQARPTPPTPPAAKTEPTRELTEGERRAMKAWNMNPSDPAHVKEYLSYMGEEMTVKEETK